MGIFKFKEDFNDQHDNDPYDLFTIAPAAPKDPPNLLKRMRPEMLALGSFCLVLMSFTALFSLWSLNSPQSSSNEMPFAYFEIRAIDEHGKPVPGAVASFRGEKIGVTDTFGEWRRFMRVPLGEKILVKMKKKLPNNNFLAGEIKITVPNKLPEKGDLEIKRALLIKSPQLPKTDIVKKTAPLQPKNSTSPSSAELQLLKDRNVISISTMDSTNPLISSLVKNVEKRVLDSGFEVNVDANRVVTVNHLPVDSQRNGLVKVDSYYNGKLEFTFLKNLTDHPTATIDAIYSGIKNHLKYPYFVSKVDQHWKINTDSTPIAWQKNLVRPIINPKGQKFFAKEDPEHGYIISSDKEPCAGKNSCTLKTSSIWQIPPKNDMKVQTLRLIGFRDGMEVYVSGFRAQSSRNNQIKYWGQDNGAANLTVVYNNNIIHRSKVRSSRNPIPTVAIKKLTIARP